MPFYYNYPSGKLDLEDLPLDRWITIQSETGLQWHEVLSGVSIVDAKVATVVVREACGHLGIEVPTLTLRTLLKAITFEQAENVPEQYNDGVPDPKAKASEPVTT